MGHSKEIITMDVYGNNRGIIVDGMPEIEEHIWIHAEYGTITYIKQD